MTSTQLVNNVSSPGANKKSPISSNALKTTPKNGFNKLNSPGGTLKIEVNTTGVARKPTKTSRLVKSKSRGKLLDKDFQELPFNVKLHKVHTQKSVEDVSENKCVPKSQKLPHLTLGPDGSP